MSTPKPKWFLGQAWKKDREPRSYYQVSNAQIAATVVFEFNNHDDARNAWDALNKNIPGYLEMLLREK